MKSEDYSILQKAIDFANDAHRGTVRKVSGIPYFTHVMEVYKLLFNMGVRCPYMLAAAILHDIVEDTKYKYDDLVREFGKEVADYVLECSRIVEGEETLQVKLDFMKSFKDKSIGSVLIKIADRYANTMDYKNAGRERYAAWYALQAYPLYQRFWDAYWTCELQDMGIKSMKYASELEGLYNHFNITLENNDNELMIKRIDKILLEKPNEK